VSLQAGISRNNAIYRIGATSGQHSPKTNLARERISAGYFYICEWLLVI
jgi:hypothetical protein